ncbi:MAG TPA: hypothetical protein VH560_13205 [Polyangia bacterium]|nr:hypothetical protein [Polyangia bacterium]
MALDANFVSAAPPLAMPEEDLGDPPPRSAERSPAPRANRGAIHGSFATIHFKNDLGKTLSLVEARLTLDGNHLPAVVSLGSNDDSVVFAGRVTPGHHLLGTHLACRGNQRGPFTYLQDYTWDVTSDAVLTVPDDEAVVFTIAATRTPGANVPLDKQVTITVRDHVLPPPVSAR